MQLRVLMVEDVDHDAQIVVRELARGGIEAQWTRVETRDAMWKALHEQEWDVVISDYSMPAFSGLDALATLRKSGKDIPFIVVSGTIGEATAVEMMRAGAQDYFIKGYLGHIVVAIERELREAELRRQQRAQELALREIEARFNAFMNNVPTPAWIKDEQFRYVYVNASHARLLGLSPEEVVGRDDFALAGEAVARPWRDNDRRVLTANCEIRTVENALDTEGQRRIFTVLKFPLEDARGRRLIAGVSLDISERVRSREQLETANRQLHMLSRKVLEAQEQERRNLARGLHDDVGQTLTAIKINLEALRKQCERADIPEVREQADETIAMTVGVLQQVRGLCLDLRPPQLDDIGLAAALRWYMEKKTGPAELASHFMAQTLPPLHADIETTCFRIAQEAIINILRHARAGQVWVELSHTGEDLHLMVRDDGRGFDVAATSERAARGESLGLINMQERAALVGGRIEIDSSPGCTVVDVFLPVHPQARAAAGGAI